jgi:dihydrofolate synthase/folylpolyglutamate synthase
MTALAMLYFRQQAVDITVLEVGLGGRLDSTNVCRPLVSVITSISFDHMRQLGNTLTAIATEKAGIIKPGVPVVSGAAQPEVRAVIEALARRQQSRLVAVDEHFRCLVDAPAAGSRRRNWQYQERQAGSWRSVLGDLPLGILGRHQYENAAVAVAALRSLPATRYVPENALRHALSTVRCPARIEQISSQPPIILDAAHNVASTEALMATLDDSFEPGRRTLLLATTRGKDVEGMLRCLLSGFHRVICTRYLNNPRSWDPGQLSDLVRRIGLELQLPVADHVCSIPDPTTAWRQVREQSGPDELICVTGSFFIAAEVRAKHLADQRRTAVPG